MNNSMLENLCEVADSFYRRGYAFGSTGNLSVRVEDEIWITPTGQSLKGLTPARLARIDLQGASRNENRPSKEFPFHLAVYKRRTEARAIIHLHTIYSVALSCLKGFDPENPLPPLTPYYFMRVAPLAVLPYFRPGSTALAEAVGAAAPSHNCMLLSNHGVICAGSTLSEAVDRTEELEQTARLYFILRGEEVRHLTGDQIEELKRVFG
ncbi:MAG TPA: 3-oxo-tetronate 4-phosphate decarboxylase [Pyrinomonadaceae bacterium]|jgi:ribulose-5-phosphate 4-epimerase/fuculose-1-phosphate aldolase